MIKTADELKDQATKNNIGFYPVHDCSMCGYKCGYVIEPERVGYDSGCYCTDGAPIRLADWNEIAHTYNMNQPENNPKIDQSFLDELNQTWKFEPNDQ